MPLGGWLLPVMETKFPIEVSGGQIRPSVSPDWMDLLRQLDSLEARVTSRLSGELILKTVLGEILAKNTLGFKNGDRLMIRLDESRPVPTLKVAPSLPAVQKVNSDQLPLLSHLIGPDRAILAPVKELTKNAAVIEFANRQFKLPSSLSARVGELLSIYHSPRDRVIEVSQFNPLPVYKALLRQLIPKQSSASVVDLSRLLKIFSPVEAGSSLTQSLPITEKVLPATRVPEAEIPTTGLITKNTAPIKPTKAGPDTPRQNVALPESSRPGNPSVIKPLLPDTNPLRPAPETPSAVKVIAASINRHAIHEGERLAQPAEKLPGHNPGKVITQTVLQDQYSGTRLETISANNLPNQVSLNPFPRADNQSRSDSTIQQKSEPNRNSEQDTIKLNPTPLVTKVSTQNLSAPINRSLAYERLLAIQNTSIQPAQDLTPPLAKTQTQPARITQAAENVSFPTELAPKSAPVLATNLLDTAIPIRDIQVHQIKQWFSFWGLIRPGDSEKLLTDTSNPFKVLSRIADQERFLREISLPRPPALPTSETKENPEASKPAFQELSALQIREGIKLIESSLMQYLLQRASLGLQQESEQPVNINLALPLLDETNLIPVSLKLEQRDADSHETGQSWDVRINIDFPSLGPICCHLFLQGENLAVSFYSEKPETRDIFDSALPLLRKQLFDAGFTPGELFSFQGLPASADSEPSVSGIESLLDIRV